jgi:hypothetical protein
VCANETETLKTGIIKIIVKRNGTELWVGVINKFYSHFGNN